jgi:hypothetical protein
MMGNLMASLNVTADRMTKKRLHDPDLPVFPQKIRNIRAWNPVWEEQDPRQLGAGVQRFGGQSGLDDDIDPMDELVAILDKIALEPSEHACDK